MVLGAGLAGCGGAPPFESDESGDTGFSSPEDSLGLDDFLALEPERQRNRRDLADKWLERSRKAPRAADRIQALATAGGLTPDDPEIWLDLAKVWRWIGDNIRTENCLDNAAAAVRELGKNDTGLKNQSASYRRDAALRTGILRAWLHYDRAEYSEGLGWAKAAVRIESGNAQGESGPGGAGSQPGTPFPGP